MSQAPCTLFWPRRGLTPAPAPPTLPVSIARLAVAITFSVPWLCSQTPMAYRMVAGPFCAYIRAACTSMSGSTPVISDDPFQRDSSCSSVSKASKFSHRSSMNAASCRPSSRMTRHMPISRATSVPYLQPYPEVGVAHEIDLHGVDDDELGAVLSDGLPYLHRQHRDGPRRCWSRWQGCTACCRSRRCCWSWPRCRTWWPDRPPWGRVISGRSDRGCWCPAPPSRTSA